MCVCVYVWLSCVEEEEEHRKVGKGERNSFDRDKRAGMVRGGSGDYLSKISTSDTGPTKGNLIDFGRQKSPPVL